MKKTQTAYKILQHLSDGSFHSGEALGKKLGITRSAAWKAIQQLTALNIPIESIAGKGYRIPHGIELLNPSHIKHLLSQEAKKHLDELVITEITHSTNDDLLERIRSTPEKNIACFAEYQTNARGRRNRPWIGAFGTNIYHSLLWHFSKDPAEIVGLSLAIAVAVVNALKKYGVDEGIQLKWPNDVLWHGKKLAGILLETVAENHGHCAVVIGVGINTHLPHQYAHSIDQAWTDLRSITKTTPRRNHLAGLLLNELIAHVQKFEKEGLTPFLETWRQRDVMMGKKVTLDTPRGNVNGVMKNISDRGELILSCENNQEKYYLSGELSLRLREEQP